MEKLFSRNIDKGKGPSRLFVGGVHGKEGQTTIKALKSFDISTLKNGRLLLYNFPESFYISTLNRKYFDSPNGIKLLNLIKKLKPNIYLELHCYKEESYLLLTCEERKIENGIPSLVELDKGILMGSVSPIIRSVFFKQYDFPFILEIPCNPDNDSLKVFLDVMTITASSDDRFEILRKLGVNYPQQVKKLQRYFLDYSDNFMILFQMTSDALRNHLICPEELKTYMKGIIDDLDLNLNAIQIEQVAEAVMIFKKMIF
jgi:hypothetical protein